MARRRFAPSHSCTGPHIYVDPEDSAWDVERIDREVAEIEKRHGFERDGTPQKLLESPAIHGPDAHVVHRYWQGVTRFDLNAEGVREYLDANKAPEQWQIRPLTLRELHRLAPIEAARRWDEATLFAFLLGCEGMVDPRGSEAVELDKLLRARAANKPAGGTVPNDDQVLAAVQKIAYEIPRDVGQAVQKLSRDLSEEEKKRSAGPHGASSETGTADPASAPTPSSASGTA